MRTTLTLDPDIAAMLEAEAHRLRQPFKQVVNNALRRGLSARKNKPAPYRAVTHHSKLLPGIDPTSMNRLVDEIEQEEHSKSATRRK